MSLYIPNGYSKDNKIFSHFSIAEHHDMNPDHLTIIIIIDALSDYFFREHIAKAPNLSRFIENGAYYFKNTTCIPSCTGIGHTHILTGAGADEHHVCGLNYLDQNVKMHFNGLSTNIEILLNNGLSHEIHTIFENNPGVKSASIWNPVTRGADVSIPYFKTWYRHAARMTMEQIRKGARIITIWYPLLDPMGHYLGTEHAIRKFWWHRIDYQIGLLSQRLKQEGYIDKSLIYITSDHGQTKVNQSLDLYQYFRKMGYKTLGKDHTTISGEINSNDYDIFVCRNGYRFAHLYFGCHISEEKISHIKNLLLQEDAIRNVFYRVGEFVFVESKLGKGVISITNEQNPKYHYEVINGLDPLLYQDKFFLGKYFDEATWKNLTMYSESPNVVPQIYQLMTSYNAGDLCVAASSLYHFSSISHKAAHGGLDPEELVVPSIILFPEYANQRSDIKGMSFIKK